MTRSQVILMLLTVLIALQACAKTFPDRPSPDAIAVAAARPTLRAGRRSPPVQELCRQAPDPTPVVPSCGP